MRVPGGSVLHRQGSFNGTFDHRLEKALTRSGLTSVLLAVVLTASLAACGDKKDPGSLPSLGDSTSATPSSTPTPSSASVTPTAVPTEATAKYRDLTLVLKRPAARDPKAEPGIRQFLKFHQLLAGILAGGPTTPELSQIADPSVVQGVSVLEKPLRQAKERSGGQLTVHITKTRVSGSLAVIDGCFDQTKLVTIRPNGTRYVDASTKRNPTMVVRSTLSDAAGLWRVTEYVLKEGKC